MMQKLLFAGILFFTTANIFAQPVINGSIKGQLRDTTEHQVLKRATVMLLHKDSTLTTQVLSGDDGNFLISNIPSNNYILKIVFNGYETRFADFTIDNSNTALNAGIIYLVPQAHELQTVIVQTSPIVIKKDTVEYSAGSFNTKPNATAEDL